MDPYLPPETDAGKAQPPKRHAATTGAALGCFLGGCVIPAICFVALGIVFGEPPSSLKWPLLALILGGVGTLSGGIWFSLRK